MLTPKQQTAIDCLLTAPTHREAAIRAGISEPTLYRWCRSVEFAGELQRARAELDEQFRRRRSLLVAKLAEAMPA